eukprot:CAMPEP_0176116270 /NCGR_PEP_ID=MMETSP0120_2-20121206/58397_1 /TAXON_ID=160619 /ORGANISM="Kryptoperidinium foliaceum, Strain CCMP 1326" /LENGTH=33 /DNA_ID= /DNA_START= /DNA_END= /DNA_ORIENTATION=
MRPCEPAVCAALLAEAMRRGLARSRGPPSQQCA